MKAALAPAVTEDIWDEYKSTRSLDVRNKILMQYLGIVKCIAIKMNAVYRNKADLEDIINEGVLVLMDCIDKYEPDRGVKFETFASIRIRGSIIDYIRNQDWVPRSLRKKVKDIEDTYTKLQSETGRYVTDEEVAQHLNMSKTELSKTIGEANAFFLLSYEELLLDNSSFNQDSLACDSTEWQLQDDELKQMIALSIDELNESERTVISLYYYEELKLKDIAKVLELTQSRVSQIHSKALLKMKRSLKKYLEE